MLNLDRLQPIAGLLDRLTGIDVESQALVFIYTAEVEGRPLAMASLAAFLKRPRASAQRLVNQLVSLKLVAAAPAAADRRRVELRTLPAGVTCAEAALASLAQALSAYREEVARAQGARIKLRKFTAIDPATASPRIRAIYHWASQGMGDVPISLLPSLFIARPDFNDISRSAVFHWGYDVVHGNAVDATRIARFHDTVSKDSSDYYRCAAQAYQDATDQIVAHRIDVDWSRPLSGYERILIPHPKLGVIGCTQWY